MTEPLDVKGLSIDRGVVEALRTARHVVVMTGAGMSAESGIPTFRDALTGLWARFRPEELATPAAFHRNPQLVWDWYAERRQGVQRAAPNPGHAALVVIEQRVPTFTLITQNVDGLHVRAGSRNVIELHGNITRVRCSAEGTVFERWSEGVPVPRCPQCGALLRPDVVWFGEALPVAAIEAAERASEAADLFFSIGTSGVVEPAASLPHTALAHGARVIEVNTEETPLTPRSYAVLNGRSGVVLPALVATTWPAAKA